MPVLLSYREEGMSSPSASAARPPVPSSTASDQPGKLIECMQICLKPTDAIYFVL